MAAVVAVSFYLSNTLPFRPVVNVARRKAITCQNTTPLKQDKQRRSANYHPSIWDPKAIESLNTPYNEDSYCTKLEEMKQKVKSLLGSTTDPRTQLNLIDAMQRLGVDYHFEDEISETLTYMKRFETNDLYTTALHFRILRQSGIMVDSGVFERFRDDKGNFMTNLRDDIDGLLSLYEASCLGIEGEDVLEEARIFSTQHLKSSLSNKKQAEEVRRALEIPSQWRMRRIEARSFIDLYQNKRDKSMELLEFAKLDFNIVQSIYQRELKELARWWSDLGFKEHLPFSRDRLMELYLWSMGVIFEPQFSKGRIGLAKFFCLLTAMDDIYDIYGSIDELEAFSHAFNRWDINETMENLPLYMRIFYLATFNFCNELAYDIMQKHGINAIPYIIEEFGKQCESYLLEAQWFARGYIPSFKEYLQNSWMSIAVRISIVFAYMLLDCFNSRNPVEILSHGHDLIYWSCLIIRLVDDLGTSKAESKRGDVTKSIECYVIEKGVSEEDAREHIKSLIRHSWKRLNEESFKFKTTMEEEKSLRNICLNMTRAVQSIYLQGDGIGVATGRTKDLINYLIVEPIPTNY